MLPVYEKIFHGMYLLKSFLKYVLLFSYWVKIITEIHCVNTSLHQLLT